MKILISPIITIVFSVFIFSQVIGQGAKPKLYNPKADAKQEIKKAVKIAKESNKHVLLQVGGDW